MNRCMFCLAVILGLVMISRTESAPTASSPEVKYILVPMPKGQVRAEASEIARDWNPPIVHLKGNAKVTIRTATKDPRGEIVLQADAVDLNQTTGQISPRGNVRLAV